MAKNSMDLKGKNILIRTVTNFYTGEVVEETAKYLKLNKAAWIADTGRFSEAIEKSVFGEVEPYPRPVFVMKAAIVDITEIDKLPLEVK
jgi:hypothetical protein